MGFHTFSVESASKLEDPGRYRYCSRDELIQLIEPESDHRVADFGSGTGFYTDDVAPFVGRVYGVDVQVAMHELYREKGVPDNVELVTSAVESLPFEDDYLDGGFSIMTHHEYASDEAFAELARVLKPGARLVTIDWSRDGTGEEGPSFEERFGIEEVVGQLERAGFEIASIGDRPETLAVVAVA